MQQLKISSSITARTDTIDKYLSDISRMELITPEEEVELAERIKRGDKEALQKLVNANLRFVVSVAKQYQNQGLTLSDLIEDGNMGLIKAAEKFDETRGFKFISYAVWWIRQSILQGIADQSRMVRLPLNQVGTLSKINRAISKFEQEHGRTPNEWEIAELIELPENKVSEALMSTGKHTSYDAPFEEGEEHTLLDVIPNGNTPASDSGMEKDSLKKDIDRALLALTPREREVIRKSFGLGCQEMTLEEIGEDMDLTRERVRQIREKSVRKLKKAGIIEILRSYL